MNHNPHLIHHEALKKIAPKMRMKSGENFESWQKTAREKLSLLLGLDKITPASDDCFNIESKTEFEAFTDYRITFQSEEGYFVPCNLWVPKNTSGNIPMVICLQGHSKGFHISLGRPKFDGDEKTISGGDRDFAVQIIKEGYCALAIEQRGFGECGGTENGPACLVPSMTALLYGRTTIGERVFDISRAIDVITKNFDFVDADKIACMGNSGGGTATIYASAIETRIKTAMPSCALCTYKDSIGAMEHCSCNYVPNIAYDFDMGDLCGLIAPRALLAVSGAQDKIFPHDGVEECVDVAKNYYAAADAPQNIDWVEGPEGHRLYAALSGPKFHKLFD